MSKLLLRQPGRGRVPAMVTGIAAVAVMLTACSSAAASAAVSSPSAATSSARSFARPVSGEETAAGLRLDLTLRSLMSQHMEWTLEAIDDFATSSPTFPAAFTRLLANQTDIGNAIKPFYGAAAAAQLTTLLKAHINGVAAILEAAKAGDKPAETKAINAEYANAQAIADFLATANPANWPRSMMRPMWKQHITQTLVYATNALEGNWTAMIRNYGHAEQHMVTMMADGLTAGIIAQFPAKFTGARVTPAEVALYQALTELMQQHMEWTCVAIEDFATSSPTFPAAFTRLLANQTDIGNAIKPFYGAAAAAQLTTLLKAHINGVAAILEAAKAGDKPAETKAINAEYANAQAIADFLATANPANWPRSMMRPMWKQHITQTLVYATNALEGNWTAMIRNYGHAEQHMVTMMADGLTAGIIAQFPAKFGP